MSSALPTVPVLSIFLLVAALTFVPGVAPAQGCAGNAGSIPMSGTFFGTVQRDRACWDAAGGFWYQSTTFDVQRDTVIWIFYSASNAANFVITDMQGRTVNQTVVTPTRTGRRYRDASLLIRRGRYQLQIQTAHLGTRFTARPHYGQARLAATGLCDRFSAPSITGNVSFWIPLAQVGPGVAHSCIDPQGRSAIVRRFDLTEPTDVALEVRAWDRNARAAIYLSGPGYRDTTLATATSPRPGAPARLSRALGQGTHYVVFASDAEATSALVSLSRTRSTTTTAPPTTRNPSCEDDQVPFPSVVPGRTVAGRLTVEGSCGVDPGVGLPGAYVEIFKLSLPERRRVAIEVESQSFAPAMVLLSAQVTRVAVEANSSAELAIRVPVTLEPGEYYVFVGHARPTEIGSFHLTIDPD